jgi:hypothetical protein
MEKIEVMIKVDKYQKIIYIGGFNEKINSDNIFYLNLTSDEFNKYCQLIGLLYYEDNEIIEKNKNDEKVIKEIKIDNIKEKILLIQNNLQKNDYKIIKCYEAFMRQLPLPYNLEELAVQRDAWRAEINQLEEELKELE